MEHGEPDDPRPKGSPHSNGPEAGEVAQPPEVIDLRTGGRNAGSSASGLDASGTAPALSVRALSKTFGAQRALDELDLDIAPGEIHALLGQNGSGKSTFVKLLAGYHKPDAGA